MKSYASLSQLKTSGYLDISTPDYDSTLLRMLVNASEDLDHMCFRHFDTLEGTIYCDGAGRTLIPAEDILSISSLMLDLDGSQTWATSLSPTDYFLYPIDGFSNWPKTYLKMSLNCAAGTFASGIQSGVKITGVFGHGDGNSATPYYDSGDTVKTYAFPTLTTNYGLLSPGMLVRIGSEQLFISFGSNGTYTVVNAQNGTTAGAHAPNSTIYSYRYPGSVVESTLLLAANWWKQRENPTVFRAGNSITGEYEISTDIEKILHNRLNHHIKRKLC